LGGRRPHRRPLALDGISRSRQPSVQERSLGVQPYKSVALLAHWASDVVAGFTLGIVIERMLRPRAFAGRATD